MNRWYDKFSIVMTAVLLLVVVVLTLNSTFNKPSKPPADPEPEIFSVSFYDEDKETLFQEVNVKKGECASVENPSKEATLYKVYTFSNWVFEDETDASQSLLSVQENLSVYAKYTESTRSYTLKFFQSQDDEVPLIAPSVNAGESFDPTRLNFEPPYDEDYDLTFIGWVDEDGNDVNAELFENILSDITVYAKYSRTEKTFTLSFDSPYIMVREGEGTFISYQLASQMKLFKDSTITIRKQIPEGYSDIRLRVQGATVINAQEGTYKVFSNVKITATLVK